MNDGADSVACGRRPIAISTKPLHAQLTPSSAKRARRERRHPKALKPLKIEPPTLDPLENRIGAKASFAGASKGLLRADSRHSECWKDGASIIRQIALSKRGREKEFAELTDDEVAWIEAIYAEAFADSQNGHPRLGW